VFVLVLLSGCSPFEAATTSSDPGGASDAGGGSMEGGAARDADAAPSDPSSRCGLEGAVLALDFEDAEGNAIQDGSGAGNQGSLVGATRGEGARGKGVAFGGGRATSSVLVPSSPSLDISGSDITIAFWMNAAVPPASAPDQAVLCKPWNAGSMTSPYYQFGIEINTNGTKELTMIVGSSPDAVRVAALPVPFGRWVHVAFSVGASATNAYIDGVLSVQGPPATVVARGNAMTLGVDAAGRQPYNGKLDEVRIYKRALGAGEIACLAKR
jgi:hypothetical protein